MALTPYPSLATLPEVIANGGNLPAHMIDVFAARTIYASSIPGVVLDCNLDAGAKIGGGTPTDNAARLNAALATASASNPLHLVIDGGCAIGAPLVLPATGHVTISGHGWHTGFFILPGSNANGIQNFPHTDLACYQVWSPSSANSQGGRGSNVTLRDFRLVGNRGTYPNGNSNGTTDSTITGSTPAGINGAANATAPDARGPYAAGGYWLSGIILVGLDNVHIDRVWVFDAPGYHVNLYHCTRAWVTRSRIEAGNPSFSGNTDGVHVNGGCSSVTVDDCWISTGDDAVAFNLDEGDQADGADLAFTNSTVANCQSAVRIYGRSHANTRRVRVQGIKGSGIRFFVVTIGLEDSTASGAAELNHSITIDDLDIQGVTSGPMNAIVQVNANVGLLEVSRVKIVEPTIPLAMVKIGTSSPSAISSLRIADCSIHRNPAGNAAAYALEASTAGTSIGDLSIDGFRVTEPIGQSSVDIPSLVNLDGTSVARLSLSNVQAKGVGTLANITANSAVGSVVGDNLVHQSNASSPSAHSIVGATSSGTIPVSLGRYTGFNLAGIASGAVTLTGPGLVSSGFAIPDAMAGDNTIYRSSTKGGLAFKSGGTVGTFTFAGTAATSYTLAGPSSGTVGSASSNFTVTPNGLSTGTIAITPSGGGLSTPIVLTFNGSSSPQTFTIDPPSSGTVTLTPTNGAGLADPSAVTYVASAGATTVLNDTFTGTAGSSLTGHAPDTGSGTWSDFVSSLSLPALVFKPGGGVTTATGSSGNGFGAFDLSADGASLTATIAFHSATLAPAILTQFHRTGSTSSANYIEVDFTTGDGKVQVSQSVAGTTTLVGSAASYTFATGTTYTAVVQFVTSGGTTTVDVTINGTAVVTAATITDPAVQAPGQLVIGAEFGAAGDVLFSGVKVTSN